MMHTVYLLTGSNIGDSTANLLNASILIHQRIGKIVDASSVYKTEPWGNKQQQDFLNQVLKVETMLSANEVMQNIFEAEKEMGRTRIHKWEPRIIDIDILFFDTIVINETHLKIPHPLLQNRMFTLIPLNELSPKLNHPVLNKSISQLLNECTDKGIVEKLYV